MIHDPSVSTGPARRSSRWPLVLAALGLLASSPSTPPAHAAGATAHVTAGQLITQKVSDPALKALLTRWQGAFLRGALYPDAILTVMQQQEKDSPAIFAKHGSDAYSHGIPQAVSDPPIGFVARFWASYWTSCPGGPSSSDDCGRSFVFLLGALSHMIEDGPWHAEFKDRTTDGMCEAPLTPLHRASGFNWAHPGGEKVYRQLDGDVTEGTAGRHLVVDQDFDLCLTRKLLGATGPVPIAHNPLIFAPATFESKATVASATTATFRHRLATTCSGDTFPNASMSACYSCPSGYSHDWTKGVGESGVCVRKTTATKVRGPSLLACESGTFVSGADGCFRCESGYSHNGGLGAYTAGVCYRNTTASFQYDLKATCDGGTFPDAGLTGCYSCPSGYTQSGVVPVDQVGACVQIVPDAVRCPRGLFDPRNGGECWSCPAGYARQPTSAVTDETACVRPGVLDCSGVTPPAGIVKSLGSFPISAGVYDRVVAAHQADGYYSVGAVHAGALAAFDGLFELEKYAAAQAALVIPQTAVCKKVIDAGVDGKGALVDSATEAQRFIEELWRRRDEKASISVVRIDTWEYAIVKDRAALYTNNFQSCRTMLDCSSDRPSVCVAGQCHRANTDQPEETSRSYVMLVNAASGLCLDPANTRGGSGVNVGLYACDRNLDQLFELTDRSNDDFGRLIDVAGSACLDVAGYDGAAGRNVGLYTCDNGADQAWKPVAKSGVNWVQLKNGKGTCLAAEGTVSDANVGVAACADDPRQQWLVVPLDMATVPTADSNLIVSRETGACLDPANSDGARDAAVGLWRCDAGIDQRWSISRSSSLVKTDQSNLCLDVAGYDGAIGARLGLYDCDGHADQDWSMAPTTTGWKSIGNRKASTCLARSGDNATLAACKAGAAQQWITVPLPRW